MIRYLLRWTVILSSLFALPMLLSHAQPYENGDLRAALIPPENCRAPCFMGIQPDVMNVDAAFAILNGHDWVEEISRRRTTVSWTWSANSPDFVNKSSPGRLYLYDDLVDYLAFETTITQLQLWLTFGLPSEGYVVFEPESMLHHTRYQSAGFRVVNRIRCPAGEFEFLDSVVSIEIGNSHLASNITDDYPFAGKPYREQFMDNMGCV